MITFRLSGNFNNMERFLKKARSLEINRILQRYGEEGVKALSEWTPKDTGTAAASWGYEISVTRNSLEIHWTNSNIENGVLVAVLIQYGHGLKNGGYVQGRDYINPAIQPIFERFVKEIWKEVTTL